LTILAICKASNLFISRQDKMKIDKDNKWKRVLSKRDDKVCVCVRTNLTQWPGADMARLVAACVVVLVEQGQRREQGQEGRQLQPDQGEVRALHPDRAEEPGHAQEVRRQRPLQLLPPVHPRRGTTLSL
jgi:hypothetical protein